MNEFTPKSTVREIRGCKEFAPFKQYVVCPRQFAAMMGPLSIKSLTKYYPFHPPAIAAALNEMLARRKRGEQLFYDLGDTVGLYAFLIGNSAPLIFILPGGGYGDVCSFVEGFTTAVRFNELGFNAVIGQYHVGKAAKAPAPLQDVARILSFVQEHAAEWQMNVEQYAVCGFSAGGHLAGLWGTKSVGWAKYGQKKPSAMFLCYPVVTMGEKAHEGSRALFLGKEKDDPAIRRLYSVEEQVDGDYPPTFLWQCTKDDTVPFENSGLLDAALTKAGVYHEFMPVEGTKHGWGSAENTPAEEWTSRAAQLFQSVIK